MNVKKTAVLTLAALLTTPAAPAFAAEAPVPGVHVSETDHNGLYDVTFTYVDKDEKDAVKVTVTGNLQWYKLDDPVVENFIKTGDPQGAVTYDAAHYEAGMFNTGGGMNNDSAVYELKEGGDEVFTLTLSIPGNLYYYDYTVTYDDGFTVTMQDPANISEVNPANNHSCSHSLVYVGNSSNTTKGQEAVYPEAAKKGSFGYAAYEAADGSTQYLGVYLPYGYTTSKTYPTLYVSHGGGGNEVDWPTIGALPNIMDNLIEAGKATEAVVVTMDNQYFKWDLPTIGKNYEEHILPFIESHYSVFKDRGHRATCGLSAGSMTNNYLMFQKTELFKYYGSFSGGSGNTEIKDVDLLKDSEIYLTAGNVDMALMGGSYHTDNDITLVGLHEKLTGLGVEHAYNAKPGAHDWGVWRDALTTYVTDTALKGADPIKDGWTQLSDGSWKHHTNGAAASGWNLINGRTYHFGDGNIMSAGKWVREGDGWYYVDQSGARKENSWLKQAGKWYYLGENGKMATNTTINGWKVGSDGAWIE